MHNLDMVVDKTDPLVHPVPAAGFMMYPDRRRTLAAAITATDTFIPTTASTAGLLAKADKSRFHGRDLRIGDEIVTYDDLQTTAPYGFTGVQTRRARHRRRRACGRGSYRQLLRIHRLLPSGYQEPALRPHSARSRHPLSTPTASTTSIRTARAKTWVTGPSSRNGTCTTCSSPNSSATQNGT